MNFPNVYASEETWFGRMTSALRMFVAADETILKGYKRVLFVVDRADIKVPKWFLPNHFP